MMAWRAARGQAVATTGQRPCIESPTRSASDHPADTEGGHQRPLGSAYPGETRRQGGTVVQLADHRDLRGDVAQHSEDELRAAIGDIDSHATRGDAIHHQAMAENRGGYTQQPFPKERAMSVHGQCVCQPAGLGQVVEMTGDLFDFQHDGAENDRPRWGDDVEGGLDGRGKGDGVSNGRIGGQAGGEPGSGAGCLAADQRQDAFVGKAQVSLRADDDGSVEGQAKLRGFLDVSPDWTEGQLHE